MSEALHTKNALDFVGELGNLLGVQRLACAGLPPECREPFLALTDKLADLARLARGELAGDNAEQPLPRTKRS